MKWATPYERASRCTGSVTPGARALLAYCLETYPGSSSMGIYNCRNARGSKATSVHSEGRALDLDPDGTRGGNGYTTGRRIVADLGGHGARLGVQFVIYNRESWSAAAPNGRYYGGVHPHNDHLHIELTWAAARNLTLATLRSVLGGPATTSQEDEGMIERGDTGDPVKRIQWRINRYLHQEDDPRGEGKGHGLAVDGVFGDETEKYVRLVQNKTGWEKYPGKVDWALGQLLHDLAFRHTTR